tara:strand:- start:353 stop:964 length:612 start_codon:yes stop_codon:yes gene_type:complete
MLKENELFCRTLEKSLGALRGVIAQDFVEQCWKHWRLLIQWNKKINLTAIRDPMEGALLHYRDSIEAAPLLHGNDIIDFGSGAGFPGIPLAIAFPDKHFTLLESRRKRCSFLKVVKSTLKLPNIRVLECRAEDPATALYSCGLTRATFSTHKDLEGLFTWLLPSAPLLVYRSCQENTGSTTYETHEYQLMNRQRALEIWQRSG